MEYHNSISKLRFTRGTLQEIYNVQIEEPKKSTGGTPSFNGASRQAKPPQRLAGLAQSGGALRGAILSCRIFP